MLPTPLPFSLGLFSGEALLTPRPLFGHPALSALRLFAFPPFLSLHLLSFSLQTGFQVKAMLLKAPLGLLTLCLELVICFSALGLSLALSLISFPLAPIHRVPHLLRSSLFGGLAFSICPLTFLLQTELIRPALLVRRLLHHGLLLAKDARERGDQRLRLLVLHLHGATGPVGLIVHHSLSQRLHSLGRVGSQIDPLLRPLDVFATNPFSLPL